MIIRCPKCKTKFVLKNKTEDEVLGKQVKCCKCDTQWTLDETSFMMSPQKQISFDIDDTILKKDDVIPEEKQQEIITPVFDAPQENYTKIFIQKNKRYLMFAGIFIIYVFISYIVAKSIFFKENEKTGPYAQLLSTDISKGANPKIVIYGKIINNSSDLYQVPRITILFLDDKGRTISRRFGEIDQKLIGKNSDIDFSFTFAYIDANIKKVKVYLDK